MSLPPPCDVWGCGHHYASHTYQSNTGCYGPCLGSVKDKKGRDKGPCECKRYRRPEVAS